MIINLTFNQLHKVLPGMIKANITPALMGEAGIGKSSAIEDLARQFKTKVFTLPVNQIDLKEDLTGARMVENKDTGDWGQAFFPHQTIMESIRYAKDNPDETPILFLDEFNRTNSGVTSAVLSLQTLRRIGTTDLPDNLRIVVAGNDSGNITSLDSASITRFAIFHVKPDTETFLSIQELNPFVESVMRKHPEDLLAPQLQEVIESDDDDDDMASFDLASEFLDDNGFEQRTVPRTITNTSSWLDSMKIDKSGTPEELATLQTLFEPADSGEGDILRATLVALAGHTDFTIHLYDEIQEHMHQTVSGAVVSNKAVLDKFRPKQDVINQLSRAKDSTEVSDIVTNLDEVNRQSLLIWLFEISSAREVNNNDAIAVAITELSNLIDKFDQDHMKGLNTILANDSNANINGIQAFIDTGTSMAKMYTDLISATLGI